MGHGGVLATARDSRADKVFQTQTSCLSPTHKEAQRNSTVSLHLHLRTELPIVDEDHEYACTEDPKNMFHRDVLHDAFAWSIWGINIFQRLQEKSVFGNMMACVSLREKMATLDKLRILFVFWDCVGLAPLTWETSCS